VHVEVIDAGTWRPPPSDRGFRGRGLELISALAHDVEVVHPQGSGTCVRFRFPAGDGADDAAPAPAPEEAPGAFGAAGNGPARLLEHDEDGPLRLSVLGELDLATSAALRDRLLRRIADLPAGGAAVVDLGPATYLASAGVGLLLEARAAAVDRGVDLRVRTRPGSAPERILLLAGLADEFAELPVPRSGG
jgi:anti-anti-sigma factor